jgi:hypothetical protein
MDSRQFILVITPLHKGIEGGVLVKLVKYVSSKF